MRKIIISLILIIFIIIPFSKTNLVNVEEVTLKNKTGRVVYMQNEIVTTILGQIEFVNENIKLDIEFGTSDEILDTMVVGLHELSENLDKEPNNIILAAHNRIGVFKVLEKLKTEDIVKIHSKNNTYLFKVSNISRVSKDKIMEYKTPKQKRILTLITCINNDKQRLIITLTEI